MEERERMKQDKADGIVNAQMQFNDAEEEEDSED